MPDRLFYTSKEMAKMCGIHEDTWRRWVRTGEAPDNDLIINNNPRWTDDLIKRWIKNSKKKQTLRLKQVANNRV